MIARQLLDALAYMHLNNVTHRDLKLENLLLARPNDISSVVIADFGLARNAKTARQVFQTQCGTPSYVAPEILLGKPYTPAVDVWSMGLTCLSVALARQVTTTVVLQAAKREAVMGELEERGRPLEFRALCESMLQVEPGERPTPSELCGWYGFEPVEEGGEAEAGEAKGGEVSTR